MNLTLGFSPCPNDTFIFDAMLHGKIDTEGLSFIPVIEDVETLNSKAFQGELNITKLSYHAYAYLTDKYILLNSGSALGFGVGPLLISKYHFPNLKPQISHLTVGIPGKYTTANFLLSLAYPEATKKREIKFSEIENSLLSDDIDIGVIIHENRFTYKQRGLNKIVDLGAFWEKETGGPIPLGGIVINRELPEEIQHKVNRVLRNSVDYAFKNPKSSYEFVKAHSREMREEVMYKHIELYVNKYSLDLTEEGREAVMTMFGKAQELQLIPELNKNIFLQ